MGSHVRRSGVQGPWLLSPGNRIFWSLGGNHQVPVGLVQRAYDFLSEFLLVFLLKVGRTILRLTHSHWSSEELDLGFWLSHWLVRLFGFWSLALKSGVSGPRSTKRMRGGGGGHNPQREMVADRHTESGSDASSHPVNHLNASGPLKTSPFFSCMVSCMSIPTARTYKAKITKDEREGDP